MDNNYNIKTEKMNVRFKSYESMAETGYFEHIERLKHKPLVVSFLLLYTIILFFIMFFKEIISVLSILIVILCFCIILLYISIITDIIIPDKLKEIYEKAHYIHGYILNKPLSSVEIIEEYFFKPKEIDDFLTTIMSGIVLEKRECFRCKKEMNFIHYYRNNISEMSIQQLEKIWRSPRIQIFCCKCYNKKLSFKKWKQGVIND